MTPLFDINLAIKLCDFSAAAYGTDDSIRAFCSSRGYAHCEIIKHDGTDTLVFVACNGKEIIVTARGTRQDIRDWLVDMDIRFTQWTEPDYNSKQKIVQFNVHDGFSFAYAKVMLPVYQAINRVTMSTEVHLPTFFTGHSLGAAIALLLWMSRQTFFPETAPILYNFGQPRVGDKAFARYINSISGGRFVRFVHNLDPVPRVPFRAGKYWHNDDEAWFDDKNNVHMNEWWWNKLPGDGDALWNEMEMFGAGMWHRMEEKFLGANPCAKCQGYLPLIGDHAAARYGDMLACWKESNITT